MKISTLVQGWYGRRVVLNMKANAPRDWTIITHELESNLPAFIEEPERLLTKPFASCNLILSLGEHPAVASLLPELAKATGAEAVVAPIDDSRWLPPAVRRRVEEELRRLCVAAVFPKPFCSLEANSGNCVIDEFAVKFGKPDLRIALGNDVVVNVDVLRGSPCGSTHFVARRLKGLGVGEVEVKAGLFTQTYPCLASRVRDSEYDKPLIHVAARILQSVVHTSLRSAECCGERRV